MPASRNKPDLEELYRALACLQTPEEAVLLLEDLCTPTEISALAQRIRVARLLDRGEPYLRIVGSTGVSSSTVSRVNRCLSYGRGYRLVFDRLDAADGKD
jgi:TrpR-related protein YerC/YecD